MLRSEATGHITGNTARILPLPGREPSSAAPNRIYAANQVEGDEAKAFNAPAIQQVSERNNSQALQIIISYAPPSSPSVQVVQGQIATQARINAAKPALADTVVHELLASQEFDEAEQTDIPNSGRLSRLNRYSSVEAGFVGKSDSLFSLAV